MRLRLQAQARERLFAKPWGRDARAFPLCLLLACLSGCFDPLVTTRCERGFSVCGNRCAPVGTCTILDGGIDRSGIDGGTIDGTSTSGLDGERSEGALPYDSGLIDEGGGNLVLDADHGESGGQSLDGSNSIDTSTAPGDANPDAPGGDSKATDAVKDVGKDVIKYVPKDAAKDLANNDTVADVPLDRPSPKLDLVASDSHDDVGVDAGLDANDATVVKDAVVLLDVELDSAQSDGSGGAPPCVGCLDASDAQSDSPIDEAAWDAPGEATANDVALDVSNTG